MSIRIKGKPRRAKKAKKQTSLTCGQHWSLRVRAAGPVEKTILIVALTIASLFSEQRLDAPFLRETGINYKQNISSIEGDPTMPPAILELENKNDAFMSQPWGYLELDNATSYCDVVRRSRLYSRECNNLGLGSPRRILITSTGRSGTGFLEHILRDVGLQVGHDNTVIPINKSVHGAVSWVHAFSDDTCRYPDWAWRRRLQMNQEQDLMRGKDRRNFLHVLHVVRDPMRSILSRWNMGQLRYFAPNGRCNTAERIKMDPKSTKTKEEYALQETLRHWVLWNSFIDIYSSEFFRTEDLSGMLVHRIYDIAGEVNPDDESKLPPMRKKIAEIDAILENKAIFASFSNSDHTKKPKFNLTWDRLDKLNDPDYVAMAQMMAQRYGYNISEELVQRNELSQKKQVCGFNTKNLWDCKVEVIAR